MPRPLRPHPLRAVRAVGATVLACALTLGLVGCSDDEDPETDAPTSSSGPDDADDAGDVAPPLATTASIGKVTGALSEQSKDRLTTRITEVVDGWLDAAYVGGDFPRTDFSGAYPGFTAGAAREAAKDAALTSNKGIGDKVEEVVATKREVTVDALAVDRSAVAVTARIILAMRLSGGLDRKERVRGSVFLTYRGGWKIFAYDLKRGLAR